MTRTEEIADLAARLRRQFPYDVATWGHCPECGQPARSGDLCRDCITARLAELTGNEAAARRYRDLLEELRDAYMALEQKT